MYIVIVCIVFLALRDFGGRRFISTVLLLLLLLSNYMWYDMIKIEQYKILLLIF